MVKALGFMANWETCLLIHVLFGGLVLDQLSWMFDRWMSGAASIVHSM